MKLEFTNTKPSVDIDYSQAYQERGVCYTQTSPTGSHRFPLIEIALSPNHREEVLLAIEILESYRDDPKRV